MRHPEGEFVKKKKYQKRFLMISYHILLPTSTE